MWKIDRNKIIDLLNTNGVGTSVHYTPVHMQSYYMKKYGYKLKILKSKLFGDIYSLPLYPLLKNEQIDYIIDCILDLWSKYSLIYGVDIKINCFYDYNHDISNAFVCFIIGTDFDGWPIFYKQIGWLGFKILKYIQNNG